MGAESSVSSHTHCCSVVSPIFTCQNNRKTPPISSLSDSMFSTQQREWPIRKEGSPSLFDVVKARVLAAMLPRQRLHHRSLPPLSPIHTDLVSISWRRRSAQAREGLHLLPLYSLKPCVTSLQQKLFTDHIMMQTLGMCQKFWETSDREPQTPAWFGPHQNSWGQLAEHLCFCHFRFLVRSSVYLGYWLSQHRVLRKIPSDH